MTLENLHLIDLDQPLPGQRRFISCWVGTHAGRTFVVDPGPPSTVEYLIARLEALHLHRIDLVLLTHIHLDHGGCTARVLERWPEARVYCQKAGRRHLADPGRLWEGSLAVLGRKAEVYGQPLPVPEAALIGEGELAERDIQVIPTPGHAPHHVSFVVGDTLFLGEAAGTYSALGRARDSLDCYLRPATPPRFFPETADRSLGNMLALDPFPARLCFAHHGHFTGDGRALLEIARKQLGVWVETVSRRLAALAVDPADEAGVLEVAPQLIAALRAADPHFARGRELPEDIGVREEDFTRQTLRGITGHLAAAGR